MMLNVSYTKATMEQAHDLANSEAISLSQARIHLNNEAKRAAINAKLDELDAKLADEGTAQLYDVVKELLVLLRPN